MEVRNCRRLLALGRDRAAARPPGLDPACLPMDAIERLIQHHRDMELVDRLRAERARRLDDSHTIVSTSLQRKGIIMRRRPPRSDREGREVVDFH